MWNSNLSWVVLTALWAVAGLAAILPALMSPMMFDAPGSTANPVTIALAISVALLPLVCLVAAGLPWLLRHWPLAKWIFLLPGLHIAVILALFVVLSLVYDGRFSGTRAPH